MLCTWPTYSSKANSDLGWRDSNIHHRHHTIYVSGLTYVNGNAQGVICMCYSCLHKVKSTSSMDMINLICILVRSKDIYAPIKYLHTNLSGECMPAVMLLILKKKLQIIEYSIQDLYRTNVNLYIHYSIFVPPSVMILQIWSLCLV